jgi:hypothetical protein
MTSSKLAIFAKFQNMRKVSICNGTFVPSQRGLDKLGNCKDRPTEQPTLRRGEGLHDWNTRPGVDAFMTISFVPGFFLRDLRLDRVHYSAFSGPVGGDFSNVINLDLRITIRNDYTRDRSFRHLTDMNRSRPALRLGHLQNFIISLSHLECLRLDLDSTHERQYIPCFKQLPSAIKDIFGLEYTWSKLRTLSLCHFFASSEAILSLLERHSSTIQDLSPRNISLAEDFGVMNADE